MKSVAISRGDNITRDLLPPAFCKGLEPTTEEAASNKPIEQRSLEEMESAHIQRVLDATHWHKGRACEILGISRPRLRRMIRQYHVMPRNTAASGYEDDEDEIDD